MWTQIRDQGVCMHIYTETIPVLLGHTVLMLGVCVAEKNFRTLLGVQNQTRT